MKRPTLTSPGRLKQARVDQPPRSSRSTSAECGNAKEEWDGLPSQDLADWPVVKFEGGDEYSMGWNERTDCKIEGGEENFEDGEEPATGWKDHFWDEEESAMKNMETASVASVHSAPTMNKTKEDLTAADIIARVKCGHFETLAEHMQSTMGITDEVWQKLGPRPDGSNCCPLRELLKISKRGSGRSEGVPDPGGAGHEPTKRIRHPMLFGCGL